MRRLASRPLFRQLQRACVALLMLAVIAALAVAAGLVGPKRRRLARAAALRAGSASAVAPAAMAELAGPWTADVSGTTRVGEIRATGTMQILERLNATGQVLEATEQILAEKIVLPATYTPAQPDDLATFQYLRQSASRGGNIPRGVIIFWPDPTQGPGSQWVQCDGKSYSLRDGTTLTTPDLRGLMLKGAAAGAGGTAGGSESVTLTAAEMPKHTHTIGAADWAIEPSTSQTRTTSLAGEHNHPLQQAGFCSENRQHPSSRISNAYCTPNKATTTVDFFMRVARQTPTGSNTAYTTLDEYTTTGNTRVATLPVASNFAFNANTHSHFVNISHGHTMNQAGTSGVLSTVPGRVYVGYWMKV